MRLTRIIGGIVIGVVVLIPVSSWGLIAFRSETINVYYMNTQMMGIFLGGGVEVEGGEMRYIIQGPEDGGWKSELKWPLRGIVYAGGVGSIRPWKSLQINGGLWKSLNGNAGTMEDWDWVYGFYSGDEPIIYSSADGSVDAIQADINVRYNLWVNPGMIFAAMVGYSYTRWNWEARDGYQTSRDPVHYYVGPLEGLGITYQQTLHVPYVGVSFSFFPNFSYLGMNSRLGMNMYALYSATALCDDVDDHLFRFKKSTGETSGTFLGVGGNMIWNVTRSLSLTGKIHYAYYNLDGDQEQYFYSGTNPPAGTRYSGIDLSIKGSQFYFGLMLGYEL